MANAGANGWLGELKQRLDRSMKLGFDGYCTDCESATFLFNGRCGCGSGRVITPESARRLALQPQGDIPGTAKGG